MSTCFYDDALKKKLQLWTKGTKITVLDDTEARNLFEMEADKSNDRALQLPLVCVRRIPGFSVLSKGKKPLSFDGLTLSATLERSTRFNAIPISLNYQIDIYCRYYREAEEYARNFIFNIVNFPKLTVEIPYENANVEHVANIRIVSDVDDVSSARGRLNLGQFTCLSVRVEIDDAYLFDVRTKDNYSIGFRIDTGDSYTDENINEDTDSFPIHIDDNLYVTPDDSPSEKVD